MTIYYYLTIAEAVHALRERAQLAPLTDSQMAQLGRDASARCKALKITPETRGVHGKRWPTEKAYPIHVLREVFTLNPLTATAWATATEFSKKNSTYAG